MTDIWEPRVNSYKVGGASTVCFNNFNLLIFSLIVSNHNKLIRCFLIRCRISMCQGFGFEKHYEIFEIDRNRPYATPLPDDSVHPGWPGRPRPPGVPGSRRAGQAAGASETNPSGEGWCGQATPLLNDTVHPGWPGWLRPPGIPGSHRAAWASGANATRPGDVSRRGRDEKAVAKTSCWYGGRWPRDGEPR